MVSIVFMGYSSKICVFVTCVVRVFERLLVGVGVTGRSGVSSRGSVGERKNERQFYVFREQTWTRERVFEKYDRLNMAK